jgi:hypothetical protein
MVDDGLLVALIRERMDATSHSRRAAAGMLLAILRESDEGEQIAGELRRLLQKYAISEEPFGAQRRTRH